MPVNLVGIIEGKLRKKMKILLPTQQGGNQGKLLYVEKTRKRRNEVEENLIIIKDISPVFSEIKRNKNGCSRNVTRQQFKKFSKAI